MSSGRISRREFIKYSSLSLLALNFGCSISKLIGDSSKNVALIYATKYGSTKDTAGWIKDGMRGNVDLLNIEDISFSDTVSKYDLLIIGSGVWIGGVHEKLIDFLESNADVLTGRVMASFIVCGTDGSTEDGKERIDGYFEDMHMPLKDDHIMSEYFGGRIIVEQLTEEDREALTEFYSTYLGTELTSWDRTDPEKAALFGKDLKNFLAEKKQKRAS